MNRLLYYSLSVYLSIHGAVADPAAAAAPPATSKAPIKPCTVTSDATHNFFDLSSLQLVPPATVSTKAEAKHARGYSFNTTGWDYPYNFTMNICGPVVEDIKDVVDVRESEWKNVSAYYTYEGKTYSIGKQNDRPILRGRKLVLNYTGGSLCTHGSGRRDLNLLGDRAAASDDEDGNDNKASGRRKSTIISLLCDRDPSAPLLALNFVGASPDECSYFFEGRSAAACYTIDVAKQTVGPGGVFGIIVLIAVIVYLVGGCVYSRTVLQQRGWRQCPNYGLWASALSFLGDLLIIMTSSCSRCLPGRRAGYSRVTNNGGGARSAGRGRDSDAENRLIDDLNEEWDD